MKISFNKPAASIWFAGESHVTVDRHGENYVFRASDDGFEMVERRGGFNIFCDGEIGGVLKEHLEEKNSSYFLLQDCAGGCLPKPFIPNSSRYPGRYQPYIRIWDEKAIDPDALVDLDQAYAVIEKRSFDAELRARAYEMVLSFERRASARMISGIMKNPPGYLNKRPRTYNLAGTNNRPMEKTTSR